MKTHLAKITAANAKIAAAEAKLERIGEQHPKYQTARDAAHAEATELRAKASRALALAAIGDGDEASARKLAAEADAAQARAAAVAETLEGFAGAKSDAENAAAAAREERAEATRAALDEHIDAIAEEYTRTAVAFIDATRRVHAAEALRSTLGDKRRLFRSDPEARNLRVPAIRHPSCDALTHGGQFGELLYHAGSELYQAAVATTPTRHRAAIDAEIALLEKAGLEI